MQLPGMTTIARIELSVLLVHNGHDARQHGPGDARREHNVRCIGTSQTSIAHATAINDEERGNVLRVHTGHDAEHLRPVDEGREHCAPDNEKRERNPCPHRRIRASRGSRRFLLFFLLRGTRRTNSVIAFTCAVAFFLSSLVSSSSNFFNAALRR